MRIILLLFVMAILSSVIVFADEMKPMSHAVVDPASTQWGPCPPNLPAGCKAAVIQGDPSKAGEEFALRLWVPDGYKVMPHYHPITENVTIISGTLNVGMGDKFDNTKGMKMATGSFASMPATVHHYVWAEGETVLQLNAIGPYVTTYVNPADDPSMKK